MIGLIDWVRSFTYDQNGAIIKNANGPVFSAHPQPNLWNLITQNAKANASWFDLIQLAPWTQGAGEGYTPFSRRNLNSNWGTQAELVAAKSACDKVGLKLSADVVLRQMGGEN